MASETKPDLELYPSCTLHYIVSNVMHIVDIGDDLCKLIGYTREEIHLLLADDFRRVVFPEDRPVVHAILKHSDEPGVSSCMRYRIVTKENTIKTVADEHVIRKAEDGSLHVFSVITESISFSDFPEIENDKSHMYSLLWNIPFGHVRVSLKGNPRIVYANKKFMEMMGVSPEIIEDASADLNTFTKLISVHPLLQIGRKSIESEELIGTPVSCFGSIIDLKNNIVPLSGWCLTFLRENGEKISHFIFAGSNMSQPDVQRILANLIAALAKNRYQSIFMVNLPMKSVQCVYSTNLQTLLGLGKIPISIDEAIPFIQSSIDPPEVVESIIESVYDSNGNIRDNLNQADSHLNFNVLIGSERVLFEADTMTLGPHWLIIMSKKVGSESSPEVPIPKKAGSSAGKNVRIRTFGHFEVFVNGTPIAFNHAKSKELLAILVDREGGYVSSREAVAYLWENEMVTKTVLARYRKVAMRLREILDENGIGNIVENKNGLRRIRVDKVDCDLFRFKSNGETSLFNGSYMSDYSWGEVKLAEMSFNR
ncbi:MAG: PAS domain-containing protein [Coriobacteriales bacterium]